MADGRKAVLTRRMLFAAALLIIPRPGMAEELPLAEAVRFIREAGNRLAALTQGNPSPAEKTRRLEAFLNDVVDVDGVARFCLGRFWRVATPAQQQDYLHLFRKVLVNSVAARVNDYPQGQMQVVIQPAQRSGDVIEVPTAVARPSAPAVHVTWMLSTDTGQFRIVDIVAEGISLRITQRSDYLAYLAHNGNDVGVLLRALRQQVGAG